MVSPEILLRNVVETDLPLLFAFQREPEACQMVVWRPREEAEFYEHWRNNILANPEVIMQAVEWDNHLVGHVAAFTRDGRRLIGYWFGKRYWGRGIATAAVRAFLVAKEKTRPLSAFVAVENPGSFRVLQKCGFRHVEDLVGSDGVEERRLELTG
jgi:RimJ/RimL family protein N-acetyltransferase